MVRWAVVGLRCNDAGSSAWQFAVQDCGLEAGEQLLNNRAALFDIDICVISSYS